MIPKIIHYCWFGRNPLPASAKKCIDSWRRFMPDYAIKEWNEDNFDVNIIPYTRQAYEAKKYAFVSDYARFWILYHYGGLYFDTDVEVLRSFDDIVGKGSFMGLEIDGTVKGSTIAINPGLGLGADKGMPIYLSFLDEFSKLSFWGIDGGLNKYTMIPMITDMLLQRGLIVNGIIQKCCGIIIYPQRFFNPYNSINGKLQITPDTYSIHWYSATWIDPKAHLLIKIKRLIRRFLNI